MAALVQAWVNAHPWLATLLWFIVIGLVSTLATIKYPFTKPLPKNKILDESPWKDPHEEQ